MTKPKQHKCSHCGRAFWTAQGLGLHLRHVQRERHKSAGALRSLVDEFFPRALVGPACDYCRGIRIVDSIGSAPVFCPRCSSAGDKEPLDMLHRAWSEQRARVLELEREVRLLLDDLRRQHDKRTGVMSDIVDDGRVEDLKAEVENLKAEVEIWVACLERTEAVCAEMRAALGHAQLNVRALTGDDERRIAKALQSDAGKGWVSPEAHRAERAEAKRDDLAKSERAKSDLLKQLGEMLGAEDHTQLMGLAAGLLEDLDRLKALNAELVAALERFAEFHTESCGWIATGRDACDCGVDEARAVLKKAGAK